MNTARQDQLDDRYDHFYQEIGDRHESEYEDDYGAAYRAKFPYKPDTLRIHREVLARMAEIEAE